MKTVCSANQCAGCMACADICPHKAVTVRVEPDQCIPEIDPAACTDCGLCRRICQNHNPAALHSPEQWLLGWASDPSLRQAGSSGGAAGAITQGFLASGGAVCSCAYDRGSFRFRIAESPEDAAAFAGSKYVKSSPAGAYRQIKALLQRGREVLMIGLPCQVAAAKLYVGSLEKNLYTVDLICHGTPSEKVLDVFLEQQKLRLNDPQFRRKQSFRLSDGTAPIAPEGVRDRYTLAFLNGLSYTENCYSCPYAREERVCDLTLGDAWGAQLPPEETARGVSLVLCQSDKGLELLNRAKLTLFPADRELSLANNHQLRHPSEKPLGREEFLKGLACGGSFKKLVARQLPRQSRRQDLKACLSRLGLYRGGRET